MVHRWRKEFFVDLQGEGNLKKVDTDALFKLTVLTLYHLIAFDVVLFFNFF